MYVSRRQRVTAPSEYVWSEWSPAHWTVGPHTPLSAPHANGQPHHSHTMTPPRLRIRCAVHARFCALPEKKSYLMCETKETYSYDSDM